MKEIIIRLNSDHIKVKGGEYVQDFVRCKECKWWLDNLNEDNTDEDYIECPFDGTRRIPKPDDFCSYGEREGE